MGKKPKATSAAHFIGGVITALVGNPWLALLLFAAFVIYEVIEYYQLHDTLWVDIREYVIGLYVGALLLLVRKYYVKNKEDSETENHNNDYVGEEDH